MHWKFSSVVFAAPLNPQTLGISWDLTLLHEKNVRKMLEINKQTNPSGQIFSSWIFLYRLFYWLMHFPPKKKTTATTTAKLTTLKLVHLQKWFDKLQDNLRCFSAKLNRVYPSEPCRALSAWHGQRSLAADGATFGQLRGADLARRAPEILYASLDHREGVRGVSGWGGWSSVVQCSEMAYIEISSTSYGWATQFVAWDYDLLTSNASYESREERGDQTKQSKTKK